ncbi:MAG: hypothetical protein AUH78_27720 [Gemmatimonadetes bacterium 13_1_40CM_4_69_8]|nr:MAG: hypothetical protein AUH78_27720 [Gemmatimonadetes bacterium 13_1_40CM_4_69_8]
MYSAYFSFDQRRARLVDQNRVDLVDDRVGMAALDAVVRRDHHVVAQVIEAELVVRAVGDVVQVGLPPLGRARLSVVDAPDREAEPREEMAHPLRIATREIVVDGDEVRPPPGERVQVERQRGDKGLALTRRHLGDPALVQHDPADQLHVIGDHVPGELVRCHDHLGAEQPPARFAHGGKGFGEQLVQGALHRRAERLLRLAKLIGEPQPLLGVGAVVLGPPQPLDLGRERARPLGDAGAERGRLGLELGVGEVLESRFVAVDCVHQRLDPLELALEAGADDLRDETFEHQSSNDTARARRCSRAPRRGRDTGWTGRAARAPGSG